MRPSTQLIKVVCALFNVRNVCADKVESRVKRFVCNIFPVTSFTVTDHSVVRCGLNPNALSCRACCTGVLETYLEGYFYFFDYKTRDVHAIRRRGRGMEK